MSEMQRNVFSPFFKRALGWCIALKYHWRDNIPDYRLASQKTQTQGVEIWHTK